MSSKQAFILITMAALSATAFTKGYGSTADLHTLLARSDANECFNSYLEHTTSLSVNSKKQHNDCEQECTREKSTIEEGANETRNKLVLNANTTCAALFSCDGLKAKEALKCLTKLATVGAKKMYEINTSATQQLANISEGFRSADIKKYKCTNRTSDNLVEKSRAASTILTNCIMGMEVKWDDPEQTL